ncbi:MAG: mevalonate kinase [Anaerolineae bacterium]
MTLVTSACGKAILLGEHAVVYGQPALAIPLPSLRASAELAADPGLPGIDIEASDLGRVFHYPAPGEGSADLTAAGIQTTIRNTLAELRISQVPGLRVKLHSQLPPARGLGSGTAISVALIRALAQYSAASLDAPVISDLAYRTEIIYHGHPSGIDNTVIAYEQAVYYQRGAALQILPQLPGFMLLIADTGIASQTREAVEAVRQEWQVHQAQSEALFNRIGRLAEAGRQALESGDWMLLGRIMNANQQVLSELGVSSPQIERLVESALVAGALGAKLSGGGKGGCIIALVNESPSEIVRNALVSAGASQVWEVRVGHADRD